MRQLPWLSKMSSHTTYLDRLCIIHSHLKYCTRASILCLSSFLIWSNWKFKLQITWRARVPFPPINVVIQPFVHSHYPFRKLPFLSHFLVYLDHSWSWVLQPPSLSLVKLQFLLPHVTYPLQLLFHSFTHFTAAVPYSLLPQVAHTPSREIDRVAAVIPCHVRYWPSHTVGGRPTKRNRDFGNKSLYING